MATRLLPQLSSAEAHAQARLEWEEFFVDSVRRLRLRSSWIDWLNTWYECSIPEDDSFTILSKKCSIRPIGFQFELRLQEKGAPVTDSYWREYLARGFLESQSAIL